jgi:hypothetical protein
MTVGSPRAWGWAELGRRARRRGRAAGTDGGGRGGSVLATASARLGQQATLGGATGSREASGTVGWRRERAALQDHWRRRQWQAAAVWSAEGENGGA